MAKRSAPDEQPYRPLLDLNVLSQTLNPLKTGSPSRVEVEATPKALSKVVEMRTEAPRRVEQGSPQVEMPAYEPERPRQLPQQNVMLREEERRILFTKEEAQAIDRLIMTLASRLNTPIKASHVGRALFGLLLHAERELDRRAGEAPPLTRPPNGDAQALRRFEQDIGKIIAAALRDAGPQR